jgi:HEPN domain-containing protein
VAFHSQQAIEKSLKALIENRNQRVPKIHSIRRLIELVDKNTYDLELIKLLDSLYIESRYPTNLGLLPYGKPTQEDAKEFFILAKTIFNDICNELNINKNELIK